MYKTSVCTRVNGNIEELAYRKQQKSQKVILFSSTLTHSLPYACQRVTVDCFSTLSLYLDILHITHFVIWCQ